METLGDGDVDIDILIEQKELELKKAMGDLEKFIARITQEDAALKADVHRIEGMLMQLREIKSRADFKP